MLVSIQMAQQTGTLLLKPWDMSYILGRHIKGERKKTQTFKVQATLTLRDLPTFGSRALRLKVWATTAQTPLPILKIIFWSVSGRNRGKALSISSMVEPIGWTSEQIKSQKPMLQGTTICCWPSGLLVVGLERVSYSLGWPCLCLSNAGIIHMYYQAFWSLMNTEPSFK